MKLPIIDNQVALTSDADDLSDVFLGGVRYENSATPKVRATTVSGQYQANGLSFDATGRVFYTDATAGLPAGTTFAGGLPFSPSGALCVSSGAVSTWGNGIPFAANGAVSALFVSGLTFGVTLSSVVGGLPASGTGIVTINQAVGEITPVITVSRSTGVAPLAVTFDALGTTAPALTSLPFSEIYYAWTFGDPAGGATWAYGTNPGGNLKNEANGPVAAHVFETDGSYTVTCWAFYLDSGGVLRSGSATTSITVTNANTVFSGTNTICISQNSLPVQGVNGVPADAAVQQVPNWSTVQTLASTYKRILLKRGDTWSVTAGVALDQVSRTGPGIIGAYGTGANPILQLDYDGSILRTDADVADWRFVDIDMTATPAARTFAYAFNPVGGNNLLILRCSVSGQRDGINATNNAGLYVVDSVIGPAQTYTIGGTEGYGIYASGQDRFHILGSRVYGFTTHGIRLQGGITSSFQDSTVNTSNAGTVGAVLTIRGRAIPDWTENVVVSRCLLESNANSGTALSVLPQNTTSAEQVRRVIVDGCFLSSTNFSVADFSVAEALTVRSNIFTSSFGQPINIRGQNTAGSPFPSQGFFYNNTYYNTNAGGSFDGFYIWGTVSGQMFTNNILYAPNRSAVNFTNGAGGQVTLTNNSSNTQARLDRPWAAVTPVAAVDFTPSASYAVDGGTWVPVYKNYFGTTNAAPREIGAI